MASWIARLGQIRTARFFLRVALPGGSFVEAGWNGEQLSEFEPLEETLAVSRGPFSATSRLHSGRPRRSETNCSGASRIGGRAWTRHPASTLYGNNGIAVGDLDGDGRDEVYVCQPGGLPNRLYKLEGKGAFADIT